MYQQNEVAPATTVPAPMDAKKAVDEAKTFINGLPAMHFKRDLLTKMTEKWDSDHELDCFSRGAINDAKAIKILIFSVRASEIFDPT
jgi:tRNA G26 N,N-dimethylase Trm1